MELNVIKVGNSKGVRLPKSILKEYKIEDTIELRFKEGYIELRPITKPRENWDEAFKKMANDPNEETRIDDYFEDELL